MKPSTPHHHGGYREVWDLALPATLTMVSQTIMWTVDSAMVGHVGKIELAAVGLGGIFIWTIYSFFIGLTNSINTFVAQNFGAGRPHRCAEYLWQGLYLATAAGVIILAIRLFNDRIIDLLGPAAEVRGRCLDYSNIRMLSGPFTMMHFAFANFFRGIGNTRTPMKVITFANLVNLIGDYFLIFGKGPFPALGVVGAAWATSLANLTAAAVFAVIAFSGRYKRLYEIPARWRLKYQDVGRMLSVGIPIAVQYSLDMGSFLIFSAYIGRMGTDALAVNQIIVQVLALSFMPGQGFSVAATTLMGQYIGSGSPALAKKSAYTAIKLVLIYALIVALACMLFPGPLVRIFNEDPVVVALGRRAMIWAALFLIFDAIQMVSNGALRGAGDTKAPMMITLGGAWFLFIPLAYLFGSVLGGGVVWAWAGGVIYTVFLAAALFRRLRQDRWRAIRIE